MDKHKARITKRKKKKKNNKKTNRNNFFYNQLTPGKGILSLKE